MQHDDKRQNIQIDVLQCLSKVGRKFVLYFFVALTISKFGCRFTPMRG